MKGQFLRLANRLTNRPLWAYTMRKSPRIKPPIREYDCRVLAHGIDTMVETASVFISDDVWSQLQSRKEYANSKNTGDNQAYPCRFCDMDFLIKPHGGEGAAFLLDSPDFKITIAPANVDYNIKVEYHSVVLWHMTPDKAREYLWSRLLKYIKPRPVKQELFNENGELIDSKELFWRVLSRLDYAFDIHSPQMTEEISPDMLNRVVCHSSIKPHWNLKLIEDAQAWGTSTKMETITIGNKGRLQIQIYKKSAEITQKSGKTWMYKIWGGEYKDVWRIETRVFRSILNAEEITTYEDFQEHKENILAECLKTRRLCDITGDSNRRRWPVHPLWYAAIEKAGDSPYMRPVKRVRERAAEVIAQEAIRDGQAAILRFMAARGIESFDDRFFDDIMSGFLDGITSDLDAAGDKLEKYNARYAFINSPK